MTLLGEQQRQRSVLPYPAEHRGGTSCDIDARRVVPRLSDHRISGDQLRSDGLRHREDHPPGHRGVWAITRQPPEREDEAGRIAVVRIRGVSNLFSTSPRCAELGPGHPNVLRVYAGQGRQHVKHDDSVARRSVTQLPVDGQLKAARPSGLAERLRRAENPVPLAGTQVSPPAPSPQGRTRAGTPSPTRNRCCAAATRPLTPQNGGTWPTKRQGGMAR